MTKAEAAKATSERAVLVTTEHRGVFFGYLVGDASKAQVKLRACRNVVYWDTETRGFMGLASSGPGKGCRITKPAGEESILFDITAVIGCTDEATKRFEAAPWST